MNTLYYNIGNTDQVVLSHSGIDVVDINSKLSYHIKKQDVIDFLKLVVEKTLIMNKYTENYYEFMTFSTKLKRAVIFVCHQNNLYVITLLPVQNHSVNPLQPHNQKLIEDLSNEVVSYLSYIVQNRRVKLTNPNIDQAFTVSLANKLDHKIILSNNQLYDVSLPIIDIL